MTRDSQPSYWLGARAVHAMALTLLLGVTSTVTPCYAAGAGDASAHDRRASQAREKAQQADEDASRLAEEIADLDRRIETAADRAKKLDPLVREASERSKRLQTTVDAMATEVTSAQERVDANTAEYDRQQGLLAQRAQATYRQGDWFYLEVLIGSNDFSDLILRTELVRRVMEANSRVASDLERVGLELSRDKVLLERALEAVQLKRTEAAAVETQLKALRSERLARVREVERDKANRAGMMAASKENAKRLRALADAEEAESRRIADELASNNGGSGQYSGKMTWPVPSSHRVTSPYGWRTCPFHGRELHPALDIGAPEGSAIIAAGSGKVIYVGYRGGYGNTVMIDHGDGVVTLYPHQAAGAIRVSVGQQVERGERIGGVGSTGNATGPHLHFEVRVNGSPRNPNDWL